MSLNLTSFDPVVSIVFGVLILVFPQFLNYLIAIYLILMGILGLGLFG